MECISEAKHVQERIRPFSLWIEGRRPGQWLPSPHFLSGRLHRKEGLGRGQAPAPRKESVELSPHLLGPGVRLGLRGSAKGTAATEGPAGGKTEPPVAANAAPPAHPGPDSLRCAVGHGQHPLGGNEGACADVCAIDPQADHPRPPPSHGLWVPEGGVLLLGHAAG